MIRQLVRVQDMCAKVRKPVVEGLSMKLENNFKFGQSFD